MAFDRRRPGRKPGSARLALAVLAAAVISATPCGPAFAFEPFVIRDIRVEGVQRTEPDEDLTERAWRDLQRPNQRIEMQSPSAPFVWVFSEGGGWVERDGATRELSDAGRLSALGFWPYDFYTMLHRFAAADPHLVLSLETPRRVRVRSGIGEDLGWWEIDSRGALLRWGAMSDGEPLEYVYGPIRSFGAINFPAWGAATDGSWRFDYTTVTVSPAPIDPALLDPTG